MGHWNRRRNFHQTRVLFLSIGCNERCLTFISIVRDAIYIAPSGVQKERIKSDELFVQDINGRDLKLPPASKNLKKSQCTPLFMCAYKGRLISFV